MCLTVKNSAIALYVFPASRDHRQTATVFLFLFFHLVFLPVLPQYVLAVGSSVFHAMFYGELAENKDEIHIPDVEPAAFLAMLK